MEKNQHNEEGPHRGQQSESLPAAAPGQEVPHNPENTNGAARPEKDEQHSESSFPQNDHETLGTP